MKWRRKIHIYVASANTTTQIIVTVHYMVNLKCIKQIVVMTRKKMKEDVKSN
jgi:ABC-type sugar transport system permease subunit